MDNRRGNVDISSDRTAFARQYADSLCWVLCDLPFDEIGDALALLEKAWEERRRVFLIGNGGSASTASHMACDLMRGLGAPGIPGLPAIALSDNVPLITSIGNDESYEQVFARQLAALGKPGDVLIVVSGSGNSPNIQRAAEMAKDMQMNIIALLGMGGGRMAAMADIAVIVPSNEYGPIEDAHMALDHLITTYLRGWVARRGETDKCSAGACPSRVPGEGEPEGEACECKGQSSWTATGS